QPFSYRLVALTREPRGAVLLHGGQLSEHDGVNPKSVDTVGAGDAFAAALVLGVLNGDALDGTNRTPCAVAAFVCSQAGATPKMPEQQVIREMADAAG